MRVNTVTISHGTYINRASDRLIIFPPMRAVEGGDIVVVEVVLHRLELMWELSVGPSLDILERLAGVEHPVGCSCDQQKAELWLGEEVMVRNLGSKLPNTISTFTKTRTHF